MAFVSIEDSQSETAPMSGFVPLDEPKKKPLAQTIEDNFKFHAKDMPLQLIGITENLIAGVGDLWNTSASGLDALTKASISKAQGLPFAETFQEEFNKSYQGVAEAVPYLPKTEQGKVLWDKMGELVHAGLQFVGDAGYNGVVLRDNAIRELQGKKPTDVGGKDAAGVGAASQALTVLATLVLPFSKAKGKVDANAPAPGSIKNAESGLHENWSDPNYIAKWAEKTYPETVRNLQASSVGKVAREQYASIDVFSQLHRTIDAELGLAPDSGMTITQKFMQLMDKLDPEGTVPQADRIKIADATIAQLDMVNRLANIDKTPQQLLDARIIREQMSPLEMIEHRVGIRPKPTEAQTKQRIQDFNAALKERHGWVIDPVTQVERPLTAGEYLEITQRKVPQTAKDIVREKTIEPSESLQAFIEQQTGVTKGKGTTAKDVSAAANEPSGIWVLDQGQIERQLTMGEYWEIYTKQHPEAIGRPPIMDRYNKLSPEQQKIVDQAVGSATIKGRPGGKQAGVLVNDAAEAMAANWKELQKKRDLEIKSQLVNNASGESAASAESISRLQAEQAKGVKKFIIDPARNEVIPLRTVDRVDQRAGQGKVIVEQAADGSLKIVENNSGMGNEGALNRSKQILKDNDPTVSTLITKPMQGFHKKLSNKISDRVAETNEMVNSYSGWKYKVGDRVKSGKTEKVYEIVGRGWDKKTNQPTYMYKTADGESGTAFANTFTRQDPFNKGKTTEQKGMHQTTTLMSGPKLLGKPGGKQAGVFLNDTPEAIAANKKALERIDASKKNITAAGMLTQQRYKEVLDAFDAGRLHDPNRPLSLPERFGEQLVRKGLDTAGPAKWQLEKFGELSNKAKMRFNLIKGAPGRAQLMYNQYAESIYKGLSHKDTVTLDNIIRARRVIAIDQYRGVGTHQHVGKLNGLEAEALLNNIKADIGDMKFRQLDEAANKYFRAYQDQLRKLHDEGIITDESFLKMFNLEYTPTEILEFADPARTFKFGGSTITVRDSGIQDLGMGSVEAVRMNSKDLLAEYILRTETRIMKNDANKALRAVGEEIPDNGLIVPVQPKGWDARGIAEGVPDAPHGYTTIYSLIDGKQQPMYVADWFAEQWVTRQTALDGDLATFLSLASGTSIVKTLATTINPAFALYNIPRDLQHIWIASDQYSSHAPIAALQMGKDMVAVAGDAIMRKGRWEQFAKEGGSQEYLSEQGPAAFMGSSVHKMTSSWKPVYTGLTYLGSTSEALTRLALRERAIKNGKEPWEASAIAREYLDFSDGGSWVKAADTVVPYLGAATQAVNTTAKQVIRDPKRFAWQATQFIGISAAMITAQIALNEEAWKQIPMESKLRSVIVAPKDLFVIDPDGNKRHVYFTLPLDGNAALLNAFVVAGAEKYHFNKVPDGLTMEAIQSVSPLLQGLPIPSLAAGATYASNYNFWRDDTVWNGIRVQPEDEIIPAHKAGATPQGYVEIGKITGLSPERLRAAVNQLAPSNPYTDMLGGGFQHWLAGADDRDKAKMSWQIIAENPVLRRVVKLTHPFTAEIEALEEAERNRNSEIYKQSSAIAGMIFNESVGAGDAKVAFKAWISTQPPEERERLTEQFVTRYATDKVFRQLKASDGIPSQTWWRATAMADAKVRADVFYWQWVSKEPEERRQMLRVAQAMGRFGQSYWTDGFVTEFGKLRKTWGDEQR